MNIYVQCCGYAIMFVLMFSYFRQRRLHMRTEKAFISVFMSSKVCVLLDICCVAAIYYADYLSKAFVEFVCKAYMASLILTAYLGLMYVSVDIYRHKQLTKRLALVHGRVMLIGMIVMMILPIKTYCGNGKAYTYGMSVWSTYIFSLYFLAVNLVQTIYQYKRINPRRREAILIWMGLWVGAALIQYFGDGFLLVSFAGALGIMVMYLKLENPMTNVERQSGLFSQTAFMEYVRELYDDEKQFAVVSFVFDHTLIKLFQTPKGRMVGREGINYLFSFKSAKCFRKAEDEIAIIFENVNVAQAYSEEIYKRLHQGWGEDKSIYVKTYWMFLKNSNMVRDADELFYLMKHVTIHLREMSDEDFMYIDAEMIETMHKEMEMENLIDYALNNDRLEVYYQPIYSTNEKRFAAAEALVRIKNEEGEMIPPAEFIPIAEKNGKILQIGERVFEKVCQFISENDIRKLGLKYIEVNLSVVQCADEKLAEKYISIIEEYGVSPECINLEITETASVKEKKVLLENMRKLMGEGVHFSLDDFGTGQSNLNYIVDMPVAMVKFDRDMTNAYLDNQRAKHVMDAAMNMIHGMELKIVSEGVETEKQFKAMEELGIGFIQGYYFSKPLPENEFLDFMSKSN